VTENSLAERFQGHRPRLKAIALRLLGATGEAEDAVQDTWLRLARINADEIGNLGAWLTTTVSRICLDQLRKRKTRGEEELDEDTLGHLGAEPGRDPEATLLLDESVGLALAMVLDRLAPPERVAFVLHDLFELPFVEIAAILGKNEEAVRQLASRGRRRIRVAREGLAQPYSNKELVSAFLAASRRGDFSALIGLLDPQVVLQADPNAVETAAKAASTGAPLLVAELHGAEAVAGAFKGRAVGAVPVLIDGTFGAAWMLEGKARSVFVFGFRAGRIASIQVTMEPARLAQRVIRPLG
jgi:RNA polymerase sigma factor (sigma-70 family)